MVFEGTTGDSVYGRIYRFNSKRVRKKEKYAAQPHQEFLGVPFGDSVRCIHKRAPLISPTHVCWGGGGGGGGSLSISDDLSTSILTWDLT